MLTITYNQISLVKDFFLNTYDSCCQSVKDGIMGTCYCMNDDLTCPITTAAMVVGNFCYLETHDSNILDQDMECFLSSIISKEEKKHLSFVSFSDPFTRFLSKWNHVISKERFAMVPPEHFSNALLDSYITMLPDQYSYSFMNHNLFYQVRDNLWSEDFSINYSSPDDFEQSALGVFILKGNEIVAGASSYSSYSHGIEITLATNENYRQKGFATMVSAKLIKECLAKEKNPSWDAANTISVSTATKLGYLTTSSYLCWEYHA